MTRAPSLALACTICAMTAGCAIPPGEEPLGVAAEQVILPNAILPNAILPNAILPNAILPNAILPNALTPATITASARAALSDPGAAGDLSRMFVRYAVSCAFTPSQSFSFSWTDTLGAVHDEVYPGALGLAPGWATGPLSLRGQRLVSACLAARANYFGVSMLISLRSEAAEIPNPTWAEVNAYPITEGAFWGNIFSTAPELHACHTTAHAAEARAAGRYCAAGYPDPATGTLRPCGIIELEGSCSAVCSRFDSGERAFTGCLEQPGTGNSARTSLAITTAIP